MPGFVHLAWHACHRVCTEGVGVLLYEPSHGRVRIFLKWSRDTVGAIPALRNAVAMLPSVGSMMPL
jgi:hypothetical protein